MLDSDTKRRIDTARDILAGGINAAFGVGVEHGTGFKLSAC